MMGGHGDDTNTIESDYDIIGNSPIELLSETIKRPLIQPSDQKSTPSPNEQAIPNSSGRIDTHESKSNRIEKNINFKVHNVKTHKIIILGDSRAGKSTFINYLIDISHKTKMTIFRQTVEPSKTNILYEINGQFIQITIIDTPGFGEVSNAQSRNDNILRQTISSFVKGNLTEVDAILIAINGSSGLNGYQVQSIARCLSHMGNQIARKTFFLFTHFEGKTLEEENKLIEEVKQNQNLAFLVEACKGGFLFSGAISSKEWLNVKIRDEFIIQQKQRINTFIEKAIDGDPVKLNSKKMKKAKSMFSCAETMSTAYALASKIGPETKRTREDAIILRQTLGKMANKKCDAKDKTAMETVIQEASILDESCDSKKDLENHTQIGTLMKSYKKTGKKIEKLCLDALEENNRVNSTYNNLSRTKMKYSWKYSFSEYTESDSDSDSNSDDSDNKEK